jgi:hypothetical protein
MPPILYGIGQFAGQNRLLTQIPAQAAKRVTDSLRANNELTQRGNDRFIWGHIVCALLLMVAGEIRHLMEIATDRTLRVITTLEFLEHHLA